MSGRKFAFSRIRQSGDTNAHDTGPNGAYGSYLQFSALPLASGVE
jgi:hypothetical protein